MIVRIVMMATVWAAAITEGAAARKIPPLSTPVGDMNSSAEPWLRQNCQCAVGAYPTVTDRSGVLYHLNCP